MNTVMGIVNFAITNKANIAGVFCSLVMFAEAIVRITPTQTDDGAVERIGSVISTILDFFKLPNNIKK